MHESYEDKIVQKAKVVFKSHYFNGFFLGLLNPPVLVYWLLVYGMINSNVAMLTIKSSLTVLLLFFSGVYLGKVITLYFYGKFSLYLQVKFKSIKAQHLNVAHPRSRITKILY